MRFDSLVLSAVLKEIRGKALKKRVENIYQPFPHTIVISMVLSSDILISLEPNAERIHFTDRKYPNPPAPPSFCAQLRKYIRGSFLEEVEQIEFERIARFRFSRGAELIVEIMGRHSNIILVEGGEIKGALKLVDEKMSSKRQIFPGLPYQLPPTFTRKNPLNLSEEEMARDLVEGDLGKALMNLYQGMSPYLIEEILARAELSPKAFLPLSPDELMRLYNAWREIGDRVRREDFQPIILKKDGELIGYWALKTVQPYEFEERKSMSEAVEEFHILQERETRFKNLRDSLRKEIEEEMDKWRRIKENCERALEEWGDVERYYQWGSLILANLRLIRKGMESVTLENIFDEERKKVTIPLSKELNPQQNADKYFQLYRKGKKAVEELKERIRKAEEELKVLEERYEKVMRSESLEELEALREGEIVEVKEKEKEKPSLPSVRSSDGFLILYGKNARQNELLLNSSSPDDIWLHARGVKGAHIVIKREGKKEVPMRTIREAAQLAAYLSSARGAGIVPVDWTLRKYVRKPKKREKGFVIYTREKTLYVEPALIDETEGSER
ncbi:MAG: Rqc2 family fibronectin-binding protein [bacterium]